VPDRPINSARYQDHDSPWKEALEKRFPKFLAQDLPAMIFWTAPRGPAVLNQYRERRG
jgi:hypothetical protein